MQKTKLNVRGRTKVLEKDAENLQNELQGLKMALEIGKEDRGKALKSSFWKSGKSGPIINYVKNLAGNDRIIDHVNLENIKFLKYEIPKNEVKLPGISKEEKTLKEFLKQSLGPKKKPAAKSLRCGQCEEKSANVSCMECGEDYCASCFVVFHLKGALKKHRSRPVGAESLRTPRHDVLARNVTGSPDEARPSKTFAPGIQLVSSAPTLKSQTQSNCSTTSCNNNHSNNISNSNNIDNNTSSLMNGRFNEEESALSFQRALHEWRIGHKESGGSKEDLMLHRNVRAVPSQEISVGTVSSPVVSPPKLDDLAEDLERKIQKTCLLAYSDKLLLKKLRRSEFSTSFIRETKSCLSVLSKISGGTGDGDVSEEPKSDYDVQMAASESNLAQIISEFGKKTSDGNVPVSNQFKRIEEGHNTNPSNLEICDNDDDDGDGGGIDDATDAERRPSVLIEDLHSSRHEPRHFSTKIEPNSRKISGICFGSHETKTQENVKKGSAAPSSAAKAFDHYQELMMNRGISSPNIKGKLNVKVSMNERNKDGVTKEATNRERKTSESLSSASLQALNKSELNLDLEEMSDPEDGRSSQNSVAMSQMTTNRSNISNSSSKRSKNKKRIPSRPMSRMTSARQASERGKLTKNVSNEISIIASMADDDAAASIETSLDALFMAGVPSKERSLLATSGELRQAISTPPVSARSQDTLPSKRTKDGFKISNQFYQIKQKTWRPNANHSHLGEEFSDEVMKSFREIIEQVDDDIHKDADYSDKDDVDDDDDDDDNFHTEEAHFVVDKDKSGMLTSTQFNPSDWSEKIEQFHEERSVRDGAEEHGEVKTESRMNEDLFELKSSFSRFPTEEEMIMKFFNASKDERKVVNLRDSKINPKSEIDELFISKMSARFKGTSALESKIKKTRFSPDVKDASVDGSSPRYPSTTKFSISPTQNRLNVKQAETSWPAPRQSKNVPVPHKGYSNAPLIVTGRSVTLVSPSESRCLSSSSKPDVIGTDKRLEKNLMKKTGNESHVTAVGFDVTSTVSSTMSVQSHDEEDDDNDDANGEEEKDHVDDDVAQRVFLGDNITRYDDMDSARLTIDEEELDQFVRMEKTCIEDLHPGLRKSEVLLSNEISNSRRSLESADDNEPGFEDKLELDNRFKNLDLLLSSSSDDVDEEEDIEAVKSLR